MDTGSTAGGTVLGSYGSLRKGGRVSRNGSVAERWALALPAWLYLLLLLVTCRSLSKQVHVPVPWPQRQPLCTPHLPHQEGLHPLKP